MNPDNGGDDDGSSTADCNCPSLSDREEVVVSDSGFGTGTTTWTCDKTYMLDGYVFVNSGQVLTVQPGTVVKGMAGQGAEAAALIVARGGQIFAEGTADCPITFTHAADALDGSTAYNTRGQWGGVIILGAASTNLPTEGQIEGVPSENDRAAYGGTNDADNSGVLAYVSIRHGGTQLGAANEINGLTLGGVGSGTTIHHVEVLSNDDDGIEFFGGTVDVNYAAVGFVGDDSFDWDQGYRGGGHHWFSINDHDAGDCGGELDGDDSPTVTADGMPYTIPTVTNWTMMGRGSEAGKRGMRLRNGSGGHISDMVIVGFAEGADIEDSQEPHDAYDMLQTGDLTLSSMAAQDVTDLIDYTGSLATGEAEMDALAATAFVNLDPGVDNDWSANAAGTAFTNPFNPVPQNDVTSSGAFGYMGAFDPAGDNWLAGWSYLDIAGAADVVNPDNGVAGCTDEEACNYNGDATEDDGSCEYPEAMPTGLFFSGYAEGSSNNKFLEIYNPTDADISLDGYAFPSVANAPTTPGEHEYWNEFPQGAMVSAGDVYVIAHGSADASILSEADHTHAYLSNGDDGYALVQGTESSYVILDMIGDFMGDPGSGWDVAGVSAATKDHSLVRKSHVSSGNAGDWTASAGTNADDSEWIVLEINDWSGLGAHEFDGVAYVLDCDGNCINDSDSDGICDEYEISGCTDQLAANYNSDATDDDGSCIILGCTDENATNYDSNATDDDGTCIYPVLGCTDANASNWDADANQDDGSCLYEGCTYEAASNYDPNANDDDGSCEGFEGDDDDCAADLNGDGAVNTSDLLTFLASFGLICD